MEEAKPVVLTKPARGRQMLKTKGHLDKITPGGASSHANIDNKKVETYYEGYVDGQLFLVPDSNLEAMKDMINFKMRPKTSVRYKHQTSYDIQYYDQFTEKLNELLSKVDDLQEESGDFQRLSDERGDSSQSTDDGGEREQETRSKEKLASKEKLVSKEKLASKEKLVSKEKSVSKEKLASEEKLASKEKSTSKEELIKKIEQVKSEIIDVLEETFVPEEVKSSSSSSDSSEFSKEEEEELEKETDETRIRFFISGHVKDGKKLFIVQEHDGKSDIFKDQKLDFMSAQENSNANVYICGKLYSENILVESDGNPCFLNTKPNKVIIDEEKSKTFHESFDHVFEKEDCSVLVQGKFIAGNNQKIIPKLSFFINNKSSSFYENDKKATNKNNEN